MSKVEIQGHRGSGCTDEYAGARLFKNRPAENTVESIIQALSSGVDVIEIDVIKTLDNKLAVIHSDDLNQHVFNKQTNITIGNSTMVELKEFDVGFNEKGKIPELNEVLQIISEWNNKNKKTIRLNIEIKDVKGAKTSRLKKTKPTLIECMSQYFEKYTGIENWIEFSSFSICDLKELQKLYPKIKRGMLFAPSSEALVAEKLWTYAKKLMRSGGMMANSKASNLVFGAVNKLLYEFISIMKTYPENKEIDDFYIPFTLDGIKKVSELVDVQSFHVEAFSVRDDVMKQVSEQENKKEVKIWFFGEQPPETKAGVITRFLKLCEKYKIRGSIITDFVPEMRNFLEKYPLIKQSRFKTGSDKIPKKSDINLGDYSRD